MYGLGQSTVSISRPKKRHNLVTMTRKSLCHNASRGFDSPTSIEITYYNSIDYKRTRFGNPRLLPFLGVYPAIAPSNGNQKRHNLVTEVSTLVPQRALRVRFHFIHRARALSCYHIEYSQRLSPLPLAGRQVSGLCTMYPPVLSISCFDLHRTAREEYDFRTRSIEDVLLAGCRS